MKKERGKKKKKRRRERKEEGKEEKILSYGKKISEIKLNGKFAMLKRRTPQVP